MIEPKTEPAAFSDWFTAIVISILLISVPFGWWPKDPYGLIKWVMVGIGALAAFTCYISCSLFSGTLRAVRNRISMPLLFFSGWGFCSFTWSGQAYFYRIRFRELIYLVLLYFALVIALRDEKKKLTVFLSSLLGGSAISVLGIVQYFGFLTTDSPWGTGLGIRVYATMLNPNFLAAYIISLFPLAFAMFVFCGNKKNLRYLLIAGMVLSFLCLMFTVSWGGWLGWTVSIAFVSAFALTARAPKEARGRCASMLTILLIIAAAFIYFNRSTIAADYSGMKFRILYWRGVSRMISERPVMGFGLNGFPPNIPKYLTDIIASDYPDGFPEGGEAVAVYSGKYAHNEYLEVWQETGIIGLIIFLWLLLGFFSQAFSNIKREEKGKELAFTVGAAGGMCAILAQSLVSYPFRLPATTVSLAVLLAIAGAGRASSLAAFRINARPMLRHILAALCLALFILLVPALCLPLIGENYYVQARYASFAGNWPVVKERCLKATGYPITEAEFYDLLGEAEEKLGNPEGAIRAYDRKLELMPYDLHALHRLGYIHGTLGFTDRAWSYLEMATALERHDSAESRALLAELYMKEGRIQRAESLILEGLRRHPEGWLLRNTLGILHAISGEKEKAADEFSMAEQSGGNRIAGYNKRAVGLSERATPKSLIGSWEQGWINDQITGGRRALKRGDLEAGRIYFEKIIESYPEYVPALSNLGIYHLKKGNMEEALKIWGRAREIEPGHTLDLPL